MAIAHAFLALAAGFACAAMLSLIATALLRHYAPDWAADGTPARPLAARTLGTGSVFVQLGSAFLAGAAGGYVAAWAAGPAALATTLALAVALLVLGALSALQARGRQPAWFLLVSVTVAPLGTIVGGLLRLRVLGVL